MNLTLGDFKRQLQSLSELEKSGALPPEAAAGARTRIDQKLLEWAIAQPDAALDTAPETGQPRRHSHRPWLGGLVLAVAAIGTLVAFGFWRASSPPLGAPAAPLANRSLPGGAAAGVAASPPASAPHSMMSGQIEGMLGSLEAKLRAHPEDADGWLMLARSNAVLGRPAEAIPAFRKVLALRPDDAQAQAGLAEALASAGGASVSGAGR
jgi:cytochrome c-type biogenesis protein CcmH